MATPATDSPRRTALVTGGAKRVGRAIVERLGRAEFDVAFTYLSSAREAEDTQKSLESLGAKSIAIRADLTQSEVAVDQIANAMNWDRLDVLVNSASLYERSSMTATNVEQMRRLFAIHVESPLLLSKAMSAKLRASRGHIVNMVDLLAERPWPEYLAYCTTKAALWNLTLGLARELAPDVTVNGIAPGVVEWPAGYPEEEKEKFLRRVPLGRAGTPQDVANTVHFLVTEGSYLTGQIVRLDGGRSIT